MQNDEVDKLLVYAGELLNRAEEETERSQEDVVTHLICTNARQSVVNYFAGFLMQRDVAIAQPVSLQGLLDQCKEYDDRFDAIDLTPMYCRCETHNDDYCLELDQVMECIRIAQWARSVVMEEAPGY
jgi:hypothetical protein